MKIKCLVCGNENYFTGLEDESTLICSNCNKPLVNPKIPEATESPDYDNLDLHKENIEAYKQAIRIDPNDAVTHFSIGLSYLQIGDKSSVLDEYKILKELDIDLEKRLERYLR